MREYEGAAAGCRVAPRTAFGGSVEHLDTPMTRRRQTRRCNQADAAHPLAAAWAPWLRCSAEDRNARMTFGKSARRASPKRTRESARSSCTRSPRRFANGARTIERTVGSSAGLPTTPSTLSGARLRRLRPARLAEAATVPRPDRSSALRKARCCRAGLHRPLAESATPLCAHHAHRGLANLPASCRV